MPPMERPTPTNRAGEGWPLIHGASHVRSAIIRDVEQHIKHEEACLALSQQMDDPAEAIERHRLTVAEWKRLLMLLRGWS